jgi:hypothetical protein
MRSENGKHPTDGLGDLPHMGAAVADGSDFPGWAATAAIRKVGEWQRQRPDDEVLAGDLKEGLQVAFLLGLRYAEERFGATIPLCPCLQARTGDMSLSEAAEALGMDTEDVLVGHPPVGETPRTGHELAAGLSEDLPAGTAMALRIISLFGTPPQGAN